MINFRRGRGGTEQARIAAEALPLNHARTEPLPQSNSFADCDDNSLFDAQYDRSVDHLQHELRRIDWLIKAQIVRWRAQIGASKPSDLWGAAGVTDEEVNRMLQRRAIMPDDPRADFAPEFYAQIETFERCAVVEAQRIEGRIRETEFELRLQTLMERFALSPLERDIVLVCLWAELDERYRRLYGYLMDDTTRNTPSIRLIAQILTPLMIVAERVRLNDIYTALEPAARLVRWQIVSLPEVGGAQRGVKLDERIVTYLLDGDAPDSQIVGALTLYPHLAHADVWETVKQDADQQTILKNLSAWITERHGSYAGATLLLHGTYGSGRLGAARAMAHGLDDQLTFLLVDTPVAASSAPTWGEVVVRVYREALLRNRGCVYWATCEGVIDEPRQWETLLAAAQSTPVVTFLESARGWTPRGAWRAPNADPTAVQAYIQVEFPLPSYDLRLNMWRERLAQVPESRLTADEIETIIRSLTSSFQFTEGQIADAISAARSIALRRDAHAPQLEIDDLYEGSRAQSSHDLQALAQRIEPRKHLSANDLVLPRPNKQQFHELQARIKYRGDLLTTLGFGQRFQLGSGLIALFTGSSGTGKTMGAELLALSMGVAIYRVDLSAVVSKYVGETEKNINRVFQLAEGTGAILFFDEADALFGKRGEVKDAQDRWANLEVNYLLQRVEQYSGVVILASNLRQNIDDAFARRIHVQIDFPFPDDAHRVIIWEQILAERDTDQPDVRFPDAEYYARCTPEGSAALRTQVRAWVEDKWRFLDQAALEAKFQEKLVDISRERICHLLDPVLAALTPEERAALLHDETLLLARRFQLAGGNIKNVVVDAAIRALEEREKSRGELRLRLRHLIAGVTREYQKLGKPITPGDFGEPFYEWAVEDILS
ncbi:MAG: ATP-binding protein [Chloroflexi bacterium]|nr:ATP-binding protein [Chloroflexota bacterium]